MSWMLLSKIACDDSLFPIDHWTAIERTHYMESSKLFVPWTGRSGSDKAVDDRGNPTGRDVMSMTLTDRMTRGRTSWTTAPTGRRHLPLSTPGATTALKWLPLSANERMEVMLKSLGEIYPKVDIRKHVIGNPVTVSWENEPYFMGAVQGQPARPLPLPAPPVHPFHAGGAARGQAGHLPRRRRHSWTAGWAEGAVQTALNAVWGVMRHFGGETDPTIPGPRRPLRRDRPGRTPRGLSPPGTDRHGPCRPLPISRQRGERMRPANPTAVSRRSVNSPATSGSPRSATGAGPRSEAASRRVPGSTRPADGSAVGDPQHLGARDQLLADPVLQREE
ncbi:hypothetical protein GCM10023238_27050 [Streptomyces heliomycini]